MFLFHYLKMTFYLNWHGRELSSTDCHVLQTSVFHQSVQLTSWSFPEMKRFDFL
jgi:hypothetical protein